MYGRFLICQLKQIIKNITYADADPFFSWPMDQSIMKNVDVIRIYQELSWMIWSISKFCISTLIPHKKKVLIKLLIFEILNIHCDLIVEFVALWELQYTALKHANTNHFNNFYDCFYIVNVGTRLLTT